MSYNETIQLRELADAIIHETAQILEQKRKITQPRVQYHGLMKNGDPVTIDIKERVIFKKDEIDQIGQQKYKVHSPMWNVARRRLYKRKGFSAKA